MTFPTHHRSRLAETRFRRVKGIILDMRDREKQAQLDQWIDDWISGRGGGTWHGAVIPEEVTEPDEVQSLFCFVNDLSVRVAERFIEGGLRFEDADGLANSWFLDVTRSMADGLAAPEPAWAIYLAFDRGEYRLPSEAAADPVEKYTIPLLREVLAEVNNSNT